MVSVAHHLASVIATALALCASTNAVDVYTTQDSPITAVDSADRVSASQLFQRHVTISTASRKLAPFIHVDTNLPGRIFFSYNDKTPVDDTTYAKIKISGSSEGAVGFVVVRLYDGSPHLDIDTNSTGHNVTSADSLLIEFELYKKKALQTLSSPGIADTIVLADVLYTPPPYGSVAEAKIDESEKWRGFGDRTGITTGYGSFFVADPSAELLAFDISVISDSNNTVQVEVAEFNATRSDADYWDPLTVDCTGKCNVALVAEQLSPITVIYANETYRDRSSVCIGSKAQVNVTTQLGEKYGAQPPKISWSVQPSGKTCTKLPLPDRVPALIGDYGYAPSASAKSPTAAVSNGVSSGRVASALAGCVAIVLAAMM